MTEAIIAGFYGKLPSHGDFLHHGVPDRFVDAWDRWLQHALVASKAQLQDRWLPTYLTSPAWRFVLSGEVIDGRAWAGIMLPSVDRVGRYFPLTLALSLPPVPAFAAAAALQPWFDDVEQLALEALEAEVFDLRRFQQTVSDSAQAAAAMAQHLARSGQKPMADLRGFPDAADCWRYELRSVSELEHSVNDVVQGMVAARLHPLALWWSEGSEQVAASWLCTRGLPEPGRFTAMLGGDWSTGWAGDARPAVQAPLPGGLGGDVSQTTDWMPARAALRMSSSGQTDAGKRRKSNQDACVQRDDIGVWAVADGMGGHRHGDIASRMIADALAGMQDCGSLATQVEATRAALMGVNARLRRMAQLDPQNFDAGSTVVVLVSRGGESVVLWAGDSRLYLWRKGAFEQLTHDHTVANELAAHGGPPAQSASTNEITRAVGGEDVLELDARRFDLRAGDRLLLCSDGVYNELGTATLAEAMRLGSAFDAAARIMREVGYTPARDNATVVCVYAEEE